MKVVKGLGYVWVGVGVLGPYSVFLSYGWMIGLLTLPGGYLCLRLSDTFFDMARESK